MYYKKWTSAREWAKPLADGHKISVLAVLQQYKFIVSVLHPIHYLIFFFCKNSYCLGKYVKILGEKTRH